MKKNTAILASLILILFSSCTKENTGKVKVLFTNKSAYNLSNIKIQDRTIRSLKSGESQLIHFKHYAFDSGYSAEDIKANQGETNIDYVYYSFCQTEFRIVNSGNYEVELNVFINNEGKMYMSTK